MPVWQSNANDHGYRLGHPCAPETRRNVVRCFKRVGAAGRGTAGTEAYPIWAAWRGALGDDAGGLNQVPSSRADTN